MMITTKGNIMTASTTDTQGRIYTPCPACHYMQIWVSLNNKPARCCECGA